MLFFASIILIGLAVFIIANTIFSDELKYKASTILDDTEDGAKDKVASSGIVLRYSRPFFRRYFSPVVASMKNKKKIRVKYRRKLSSAGLLRELTSDDFFAFKLFLILGFPIVFLALRTFLEEEWPLMLTPVIAVVGYFYPDIWIAGRIKKRQWDVVKSMPFIVDMLALSVEAGLDFLAAMVKVVERAPTGPLVDEFETLIKEIKIGSPRAEALRNLAWRVDVLPVSSFCATLIAADSVGASIGPILKGLSAELRQKRAADGEKAGATAATKILLPIMFFIIPSVFLVIASPIIIEFITAPK